MVKQSDLVNSVADHDGVPLTDLLVTLVPLTRGTHLGEDHIVEDDDVMMAILTTSAGF